MRKWHVYLITNTKTKRRYVGISRYPDDRFIDHLKRMARGDHHSLATSDYRKHGPGSFKQKILSTHNSKNVALRMEYHNIKKYNAEYNRASRHVVIKYGSKANPIHSCADLKKIEYLVNLFYKKYLKKATPQKIKSFKNTIQKCGRSFAYNEDSKTWHLIY